MQAGAVGVKAHATGYRLGDCGLGGYCRFFRFLSGVRVSAAESAIRVPYRAGIPWRLGFEGIVS